jgi:hypothetical protein
MNSNHLLANCYTIGLWNPSPTVLNFSLAVPLTFELVKESSEGRFCASLTAALNLHSCRSLPDSRRQGLQGFQMGDPVGRCRSEQYLAVASLEFGLNVRYHFLFVAAKAVISTCPPVRDPSK